MKAAHCVQYYVKISYSFTGKDLLPFQFMLNPLMILQILMISQNQSWIQVSLDLQLL